MELTWYLRNTHVDLSVTSHHTIRVAYNALEVVPVEPGARRYFPR